MKSNPPLVVEKTKFERPANSKDAIVTFALSDGSSMSVTIPPVAQTQLLSMLLASAKGRVVGDSFELTRPPVRALGFRHFVVSDGIAGIEIAIQDHDALHISFDGNTFQQLAQCVRELTSPSQNAPPEQIQH